MEPLRNFCHGPTLWSLALGFGEIEWGGGGGGGPWALSLLLSHTVGL